MEEVKVELGSVTYSEHFELTFVSGAQKVYFGFSYFCAVRTINCELMGVILAELEHDPDTLHSFEQRLQSSIWFWAGVIPGHDLQNINVTLDEVCCDLLPMVCGRESISHSRMVILLCFDSVLERRCSLSHCWNCLPL